MISGEMIYNYHCPRWEELPNIDLYMDQVMSVLEQNLSVFFEGTNSKIITPTMINNYVKLKMVNPPKNKKYNRGHIASFFVMTIMKQIMNLGEIKGSIRIVCEAYTSENAYNRFCCIFEQALRDMFSSENGVAAFKDGTDISELMVAMTTGFANIFYVRYLLSKQPLIAEDREKERQKKEKNKRDKEKAE